MSWNYRVIRHRDLNGGDDFLQIHEVHYDEEGNPALVTERGVKVGSETPEGLSEVLDMMRAAISRPVLNFEDF